MPIINKPAKSAKLLTLKPSDVTFTITLEQDDIPVRGNAMCSDDPHFDKQVEDEILDRLSSGDVSAWCYIQVKARWNGYTGVASIGGCCLGPCEGPEATVAEYGLEADALNDLNANIAVAWEQLQALAV